MTPSDHDDRWKPTPVPSGDPRHDIGDDARAAIVARLMDNWSGDPDLTPEKVRQLAMWAGASVRAVLYELGVLRDMATPVRTESAPVALTADQRQALIELRQHCDEDCNERRASDYVEAIDAVLSLPAAAPVDGDKIYNDARALCYGVAADALKPALAGRYIPSDRERQIIEAIAEWMGSRDCEIAKLKQGSLETCICAAVRLDDGRIFYGHRHHNAMASAREHGHDALVAQRMQGFVTTRGRFVDREEGMRLQLAAGIPTADPHRVGRYVEGGKLFSEDLY